MATGGEVGSAEAVARTYFDAVSRRDIEAMVAVWEPGSPDVIHGVVEMRVPEDLRAWFGGLFAAFPDFHFDVLDVVASGERAAVRWHATGTFDGPGRFQGLIPNGRKIDVEGCDVLNVRDGRVVRNDAYMNGAEMARQLGALPPEDSLPERALTGLLNLGTLARARLKRG
jgi:steroid delta-isomerase-like uncharacterized protein